MSTFDEIDPAHFIDAAKQTPEHGRGAWTKTGIGDSSLYHGRAGVKVGDEAEKSLDHWAVSVAVYAIQERLEALKLLTDLPPEMSGIYAKHTRLAVRAFQAKNGLRVDGQVGVGTAKALWLPVLDGLETKYKIADHWLRGIITQESAWDPGAVGYFIFYPATVPDRDGTVIRFGGVDRGLAQINSSANQQMAWVDCYRPWVALDWAAKRLATAFHDLSAAFPEQPLAMRWQAAVCNHNSPVNARRWLETGAPSDAARNYVDAVAKARGIG